MNPTPAATIAQAAPMPTTTHLMQQLAIAHGAVERLADEGISVTAVSVGESQPVLQVLMPRHARCLPGTTMVRRRCELGVQTVRRAQAYGCLIHWEVAS